MTVNDLTIQQYQEIAKKTDKLKDTKRPLDLPVLGLFGEIGSLLAEFKKRERGDRPNEAYQAAVNEELGDTLWYVATICSRLGLDLAALIKGSDSDSNAKTEAVRFAEFQKPFSSRMAADLEELMSASIRFSAEAGHTFTMYADSRSALEKDAIGAQVGVLMRALFDIASGACVELQEAAFDNVKKILDRWPVERNYPPLLDSVDEPIEQLPRQLRVEIFERDVNGKTYVYQQCNGVNIGDPLTDNKEDPDDYRFHDVFHYAYAAILGWSPVNRALFKLKRKSNNSKDENQDGARAILIEEGVATWVFGQALNQDLFAQVERGKLSYDLLKTVREFVTGYEVEHCPLWVWEEAILEGCKCFRFLKEHRGGVLLLNLNSRTIEILHRSS